MKDVFITAGALCVVTPINAAFGYFAARLVMGFRPGFLNVLLSTFAGHCAILAINLVIIHQAVSAAHLPAPTRWAVALLAMATAHRLILRDLTRQRISFAKALRLSLVQSVLIVAVVLVLYLAVTVLKG